MFAASLFVAVPWNRLARERADGFVEAFAPRRLTSFRISISEASEGLDGGVIVVIVSFDGLVAPADVCLGPNEHFNLRKNDAIVIFVD